MPNRYKGKVQDDPSYFREGKIWHELSPRDDEVVIHKPSYGAFYDTPLESILKNLGRDTVIICGTLTNFCCGPPAEPTRHGSEEIRAYNSHRRFGPCYRRLARLHPSLCALLVERFQHIPERHRDHRLVGHHRHADWFDVGRLGFQTRLGLRRTPVVVRT